MVLHPICGQRRTGRDRAVRTPAGGQVVTVASLTTRWSAISALESPSAISDSTSASRGVRPSGRVRWSPGRRWRGRRRGGPTADRLPALAPVLAGQVRYQLLLLLRSPRALWAGVLLPVMLLSGALGGLGGAPSWVADLLGYLPGQPTVEAASRVPAGDRRPARPRRPQPGRARRLGGGRPAGLGAPVPLGAAAARARHSARP
jgi:hypothetical protein